MGKEDYGFRHTVRHEIFYVGLLFCLRWEQNTDICHLNCLDVIQLTLICMIKQHVEFISKNYQHRYFNSGEGIDSRKCLFRILDLYSPSQPKAFYLRPLTAVPKIHRSRGFFTSM